MPSRSRPAIWRGCACWWRRRSERASWNELLDGLKGSFDGGSALALSPAAAASRCSEKQSGSTWGRTRPQQVGFKAPEGKTSLLPDLAEGSEGTTRGSRRSTATPMPSLLLAAEALSDEMEQHDSKYMKKLFAMIGWAVWGGSVVFV